MPAPAGLRFRAAAPGDADAIAGLHADSWQRNYRGAFSDAFLDHDVAGYLLPLWTERLARPDPRGSGSAASTGSSRVRSGSRARGSQQLANRSMARGWNILARRCSRSRAPRSN